MSTPIRIAAYGWVMAGSIALLPASIAVAADNPASGGVKAQQTQAALQQQIDQADEQTKAALAELRRLERDTRTLGHQSDKRERQLAREAQRQQRLAAALDTLEDTRAALPRIEQDMARQLEGFVRRDIPFLEQERLARVQGDDEALETTARIRRLLNAWRAELAYGREMDSWRGRLEQSDGETREVDFLRLGRIGWYYLTPNGQQGGVWLAGSGEWQALDEDARREVRHGLLIAKDQRAPELLTLPLSITPGKTAPSAKKADGQGGEA